MKKVSIIIPTYRADPKKLGRTLKSVLNQSYQNLEVIVVDDGSPYPFAGLDLETDFQAFDILWISLPVNAGVAVARNRGVEQAKGDLIAFVDTGDWWEPSKIEEQVYAYQKHSDVGLVYTSATLHGPNGSRLIEAMVGDGAYLELLLTQPISGSASSVLMSKEVFRSVGGFFEGYDIPEDRDLWLRVSKRYRVVPVKTALVHLEVDLQSRSMDPRKKRVTYKRFLEKHIGDLKENRVWYLANSNYHRGLSGKFFLQRDFFNFAKHAVCAVACRLMAYGEGFRVNRRGV